MELKWLKDFIALIEHGSFSKAAQARFVTQPAFSRRIRSLESWLGVSLVDRDQYPMTLTPSGDLFIEQAHLLIDQIYTSRNQLRNVGVHQDQIILLSQHALAVSFFPQWMQTLHTLIGNTTIRVDAGNLHDIVETFVGGNSDFLLSYAPTYMATYTQGDIFNQLERHNVEHIDVGIDELVPVSAVDHKGTLLHGAGLTEKENHTVTLLAHPPESFFGRLLQRECFPYLPSTITLHTLCENALSEALKALVLSGYGIAWLPKSVIAQELESGTLCLLDTPFRSITLTIKLYRLKQARHQLAEQFWCQLLQS